jgi:dehydrogenase/reductase SDR family protein 12
MTVGMSTWKNVVDAVVEGPVVTSFSSIGPAIRSRIDDWTDLDDYDLTGRRIVLTGGTSGLGLAAATQMAELGATLFVVGRSKDKTERVCGELPGDATAVIADMGELDQVRAASHEILDAGGADTLIHNAGALSNERTTNGAGVEATIASQVIGPHLMTSLLLPSLSEAAPGRVITMASGGMYAAGLTVRNLEMTEEEYGGSEQYARAKRAQVTINEIWADRVPSSKVVFHAMHPGWADTPGVEASLPTFRKVMGPILRSPEQGADTLVWLVADDEATTSSGDFWLDRRRRSIHKLPTTKKTDTPERRAELWAHVEELAGAQ